MYYSRIVEGRQLLPFLTYSLTCSPLVCSLNCSLSLSLSSRLFKDITRTKVEVELAEAGIDLYLVKPNGKPCIDRSHIATLQTQKSLREESVDFGNGGSEEDEEEGEDEEDGDEEYVTLPARGVLVECNDVECIFEFRLFRYVGNRVAPSDSDTPSERSPSPTQHGQFKPDNEVARYTVIPQTEIPPSALSMSPFTHGSLPSARATLPPNGSLPAFNRTTSLPNDSALPPDNLNSGAMRSSFPILDQLPLSNEPVIAPLVVDDNRNAPLSPPLQNARSDGSLRVTEGRDELTSLDSVPASIRRQQQLRRQTSSLESADLSRQDSSAPLLPERRN